nr:unnamed protein product [Callosobruchus chinensis]
MGQERLSGLALISVESLMIKNFNFEEIIEAFALQRQGGFTFDHYLCNNCSSFFIYCTVQYTSYFLKTVTFVSLILILT